MYAVIEDSGTQIKVSEGDVIKVDIRDLPEDAVSVTFDKVLLVADETAEDAAGTKVGEPYLSGASVVADILDQGRDDKVEIWKRKRRKGYTRHRGHRQDYLQVQIAEIKA